MKVTAAAPEADQTPANAELLSKITEESMMLSYTPMSEDPSFKVRRKLEIRVLRMKSLGTFSLLTTLLSVVVLTSISNALARVE
jgi:hypothetical protein